MIVWLVNPTPSPVPAYTGDPNLITPGVIGFLVTFLIAVATVLLILDMTRRIRRVRYRDEVRAQLRAEQAEAAAASEAEPPESTSAAPEDERP